MEWPLSVHPQARAELACVAGDMEARSSGAGRRFLDEIDEAFLGLAQNPFLWNLRPEGYRRLNLKYHPFFVAFHIREACVEIMAIGHVRRSPEYWRHRES